MKAFPTSNRAIQLELEDQDDWRLLLQLLADAGMDDFDLALDVSAQMDVGEVSADWREYVLPDMREEFDGALARVARSIDEARRVHEFGEGNLMISVDAAMDWYGVLNRARHALESRHGLAARRKQSPDDLEVRSASLRDRLYCAMQSLLLDHSLV